MSDKESKQTNEESEESPQEAGKVIEPKNAQKDIEEEKKSPEPELLNKEEEIPVRNPKAALVKEDLEESEEKEEFVSNSEETESETKTSSPKRKILAVAASLLIVILASVGAWFFFEYNSPERVYSDMLENQLTTETVEYSAESVVPYGGFNITAEMDSTDTKAPKVKGNYELSFDYDFLGSFTVNYDFVIADDAIYVNYQEFDVQNAFSQDTESSREKAIKNLQGTWVKTTLSEASETVGNNSLAIESITAPSVLGSGTILTGNFTDKQRETLINIIEDNEIYNIQSSEEEVINDNNTFKYLVKVNEEGIKKLYQKAYEFYELETDEETLNNLANVVSGDTFTVWVNKSNRRIVKLEYTQENTVAEATADDEEDFTVTINFSGYNQGLTIELPKEENTITHEEFEALINQSL